MQACGMAPMEEHVSFDSPLYYNELSMTFTNTSKHDILYNVGNPADDFILLYRMHADQPNETDEAIYLSFMQTLYTLSLAEQTTMAQLFRLTSSELKTVYEASGLTLSINDVVTFNTIQSEIQKYKENQISPTVSKRAYVEYRLSIPLNDQDYQSLRYLQSVYNDFMYDHPEFTIHQADFETFIGLLNTENFTESQLEQLETAYNLIRDIISKN
jgi:hypothetical protein